MKDANWYFIPPPGPWGSSHISIAFPYIHTFEYSTVSYGPLSIHGSCSPPLCLLSGFLCHCGCASLWRGHALTAAGEDFGLEESHGEFTSLRNGGFTWFYHQKLVVFTIRNGVFVARFKYEHEDENIFCGSEFVESKS